MEEDKKEEKKEEKAGSRLGNLFDWRVKRRELRLRFNDPMLLVLAAVALVVSYFVLTQPLWVTVVGLILLGLAYFFIVSTFLFLKFV